MKKFRIRRYILQFFKENRDKEMLIIDTTKFTEHQNRVIVNELWKKNLLASSRKKIKLYRLLHTRIRSEEMAESVKESIDYAEYKLKKKNLLKLLDRKTKKVIYLEKRANLLKKLPFLGYLDRTKIVLRTKWYMIPILAVVPIFALFGKMIYDSGYEQPDIIQMMVPATYVSWYGNLIFSLTVFFVWAFILGFISLAIFGVIVDVIKFTSYVFSDRYLVIELKELVERIEGDKRAIKKAREELNLLNEELELYAKEKE